MNIFKKFYNWATAGTKYKGSLKELIEYLPVGDLTVLTFWINKFIPYKYDTDAAGNYDALQNYNGADLTIRMRCGDCESKAAIFVEVIRAWPGWDSYHILLEYDCPPYHDIGFFVAPDGSSGFFEGVVKYGSIADVKKYFTRPGQTVVALYLVNDIGEKIKRLDS